MLQINEPLRTELSNLIARELPLENGLITITYVKCGADLKHASIGISVLPEHLSGTALRKLSQHNTGFSQTLKKKLRFKFIPKFHWEIDTLERNAIEIDKAVADAKNSD